MKKKIPSEPEPASDTMTRIRGAFRDPLRILAERRSTKLSVEVNRAVRELLEREGLWPAKTGK